MGGGLYLDGGTEFDLTLEGLKLVMKSFNYFTTHLNTCTPKSKLFNKTNKI